MAKPEGAAIKHPDGSSTEYELEHVGINEDGIDIWKYPDTVEFNAGDCPYLAVLPARTGIQIPMKKPYDD